MSTYLIIFAAGTILSVWAFRQFRREQRRRRALDRLHRFFDCDNLDI